MAMKKREPGFLGLAKQNAKRKGMVKVPRRHNIQGQEHYPVFVTAKEMKELKLDGGSGEMTKYGIPSFDKAVDKGLSGDTSTGTQGTGYGTRTSTNEAYQQKNDRGTSSMSQNQITTPKPKAKPKKTYNFSYDTELSLMDNIGRIDVGGWLKSLPDAERPEDIRFETDPAKIQQYLRDNPEVAGDAIKQQGGPDAAAAADSPAAKKTDAYAKDRKEDYDKKVEREGKRQGFLDEYKGFQGEAKDLGKEVKGVTDSFGDDATNLAGYQGKFDTKAGEAETRAGEGQDYLQGKVDPETGERVGGAASEFKDVASEGGQALKDIGEGYKDVTGEETKTATTAGSKKARELGEGYKGIDGQASVDAAAKGSKGFLEGAADVGGVKEQFGKEGFQKDAGGYESKIAGMADKAMSGDVGQREASMLKGRMEEGRMSSQKGSEEKLRREMAQSGASPAEIASKVAQFQRQSANQQAQAGRSETLSSQLQGQQLGQAQLNQAAGLTGQALGALGQRAGMAGKAAGLGVTQAELKGKAAGMEMSGADTQTKAKLASLAGESSQNVTATGMDVQGASAVDAAKLASLGGQGQMIQAGTGIEMEGVKGAADINTEGTKLGMAGADQSAGMLEKGMGAVEAAGGAKTRQLAGVGQQSEIIDQQGNYVQAGLASTESDITQASTEEQARLTRAAQGTPDDPRYRPPEEGTPAVGTDTGGLPPGTTTAPQPPGTTAPAPAPAPAPSSGGAPAPAPAPIAAPAPPSGGGGGSDAGASPGNPAYVTGVPDPASAVASKGGVNAAPPPPQLQGAPPPSPQGMMQQGQPAPSQGGMGMADAQRQASQVKPKSAQFGGKDAGAYSKPQRPGQGMADAQAQGGRMMSDDMIQERQLAGQGGQQAAMQQAAGKMQGGMMGGQMDQQAMMGGKAQMAQQGNMMGQQGGLMGQPSQGNQQQGKMQQQQELTRQMGQAGAVRGSWKDAQGGGAGGAAAMMGGGGGSLGYDQQAGMMGQGQAGIAQQGGLMGQNAPMNPNQQQEMEAFHKKRQQMQMQGFGQR
jgi:hypothetical protein